MDLRGNHLTFLSADNMGVGVQYALFGQNRIERVAERTFTGGDGRRLRQVDLRDNRLRTLPQNVFGNTSANHQPHSVSLAGNPFDCDCDIAWIGQQPPAEQHAPYATILVDDIDAVTCNNILTGLQFYMNCLVKNMENCFAKDASVDTQNTSRRSTIGWRISEKHMKVEIASQKTSDKLCKVSDVILALHPKHIFPLFFDPLPTDDFSRSSLILYLYLSMLSFGKWFL